MNWEAMLKNAVADDPRGRTGVAEKVGVSRAAISQLLSGNYPSNPEPMAQRIIDVYGRFSCPHLDRDISPRDCRRYAHRRFPISNPREARHWRACRQCPHKPEDPS